MRSKIRTYADRMILAVLLLSSCSTTKNLPEGQVLYTGIKKTGIEGEQKTTAGREVVPEIDAALAKAPNNAMFGSSSVRTPLPFGLWFYNGFVHSESALGKFIFKKFAAKPVFISTVNPELRSKIATNLLRDYGYFNGTVDHTINPNKKNPRKASVSYYVNMREPYFLDSIAYRNFSESAMKIIMGEEQRRRRRDNQAGRQVQVSQLKKGNQFSIIDLESERQRISTQLRNRGYYYFRPDYVGYQADTTRVSGLVDLRIQPKAGVPEAAHKQWYMGDISVHLFGVNGEAPNDSLQYEDLMIHYHDKLKVRPKVLHNSIRMESGQLYSQRRSTSTQSRFAELGIFRYTEMQYTPQDADSTDNKLNLDIKSGLDLPYDSQFELNMATKSNDYAGPGIGYSVTKRNVFGGGESFTVGLKGSYEWQTKSTPGSDNSKINSYEFGINSSLAFPRVLLPWRTKESRYPANTTFKVNADLLNRAHFFRMLSFGGDATYNFQPTQVSKHSVTPFRLTFNVLQNKTTEFEAILDANRALAQSMENQFIPAMSYTYTYDDTSVRRRKNRFWWQSAVTSAGNISSGVFALFGKGFNDEKTFMNSQMAQFVKLTSEIRYTWNIDRNQSLATRLSGGVVYSYGSNKTAPYSEQFFIGGANSIRAFTVRTIGPGTYFPQNPDRYSYLDQTGDIKLEANVEYRFRIINDLHGAVFLDAGNIWLLREDEQLPGGKFTLKDLGKNMALGTGAGLRYDLSFLVIRLDCGVALHVPYETTRSGYYNIPKFTDGLGFHLAIGYPF